MNQSFFINRPFGGGEPSIVSHCRKEGGKGIIASHPSSLSLFSSVDCCNTKRVLRNRYSNEKKEGVRLLHSFCLYALSGLSKLRYNIKLV